MSKRVDGVDGLVGRDIKVLRLNQRISQTDLANALGVSFQQVQKYENGTNRVSSGRLFKIASLFRVPITAFFEGVEDCPNDSPTKLPIALLAEPYAMRLVQAFSTLDNTELRRSVVELIERIAARKLEN